MNVNKLLEIERALTEYKREMKNSHEKSSIIDKACIDLREIAAQIGGIVRTLDGMTNNPHLRYQQALCAAADVYMSRHGLSRKQFADEIKVSYPMINYMFQGGFRRTNNVIIPKIEQHLIKNGFDIQTIKDSVRLV